MLSSGGIYPSTNALSQKADDTVNTIALLDTTTASNCKIYSNLATTVASLTIKLSSANKNLVGARKYSARLERLLGKLRIGGCTRKKIGIGGALLGNRDVFEDRKSVEHITMRTS